MVYTVESYSGGLPKGNVQYKDQNITERKVNPTVSEALSQIGNFKFTITDATSTKEEDEKLGRKSTTHLEGRAIDVKYDNDGHQLVSWITGTQQGLDWAKKYGVSILPHGEGNNLHYHIQFSKAVTKPADNKTTDTRTPKEQSLGIPITNEGQSYFAKASEAKPVAKVTTNQKVDVSQTPPSASSLGESFSNLKTNQLDFLNQPIPVKETTEKPKISNKQVENKAVAVKQKVDKVIQENPELAEDQSVQELYNTYLNPVIESVQQGVEGAAEALDQTIDDVASWANRLFVKKLNVGDPETQAVKNEVKAIPVKVEKPAEPIKNEFKELGTSKIDRTDIWRFYNKFDRKKGFNYVPIKNVGNSTGKEAYNAKGVAHYLLDADISGDSKYNEENYAKDKTYMHKNSYNFIKQTINTSKPQGNPGSTVSDPFIALYKKNSDGSVNVTYEPLSKIKKENKLQDWNPGNEVYKGYKIMSPLRQYKLSDIDWGSDKQAPTFQNKVRTLTTKDGSPTYFIFHKDRGQKDGYGKFGGLSVVFLSNKKDFAIDFTGSINEIKDMAYKITKEYNIPENELIIGYHDLGSFSAKPKSKDGKLSFNQWSGFNNAKYTGGGLAIP